MYNLYLSLADELASAGLNADIAHGQQQFYRGGSGKLLHSKPSCGRLRRASQVESIVCDPANEEIPLCKVCIKELPGHIGAHRRAAATLAALLREVSALQNSTGWSSMARAVTTRSNLEELSTNDNVSYWITELTTAIHELDVILERLDKTAKDKEAVKRACSTVTITLDTFYEKPSLYVLGSRERYSSGKTVRQSVDVIWRAWNECVRDGRSHEAKRAAADALNNFLGDAPEVFSMLPETYSLDPSLFPSVKEWLRAEWRLQRDEALDAVIAGFETQVERSVLEHDLKPDKILVLQGSQGNRDSTMMYVSNFDPIRIQSLPGSLMVRVPSIVYNYITKCYTRVDRVCDAEQSDDASVLESAAQLYDPHNGEMAKIETVIQVARAMCS